MNSEGQLKQEAHEWLARLTSGRATVDDAAAAKLWCSRSPAHARAFAEATLLWDTLETAALKVVSQDPNLRDGGRPAYSDRRAVLVGALAATVAAAGYLVVRPPFELWPSVSDFMADYRTGTGQRRRVKIDAAISVDMNTRTSLNIPPRADNSRLIELVSGEVAVATEGTLSKPLVVSAAGGRATATQAKFDIYCDGTSASVTCLQGVVAVEYRGHSVALQERQQVFYNDNGLGLAAVVDPSAITAWRDGRLVFHGVPLAQVIAQVNRYRTGRILLLNAALGKRLVDATFPIDRTDEIVSLVSKAYGTGVTTLPGGIIILS
ncbi:MAG: FecR domain-containing protein [Pseudomonadota bacterium]